MTIDWLWLLIGCGIGALLEIVIVSFFNKKSHLWEMKQLIKEASKDIHSAYEKIQALYQVVEIADMKGRVEK